MVAYRIQRSSGVTDFTDLTPDPQLINRGESPTFSDPKLDPKLTYRYRVSALNVFGRESAPSNVVSLEARLAFPLSAPLITTVKNNQNQVELSWDKVTDAGVKEITLLRGEHPGKLTPLTKLPPGATSYTDKSAPPASPRYYALQVSDGTRQSGPSPERVGRAYNETPPGAPKALKAEGSDNAITLSWSASPEKDVAGYNVYRAEIGVSGKAPAVLLNGQPIKDTRFKDDIPQGVQSQFKYTVKAINTSGVEGEASAAALAQLTDKTPPPSPLLIRAQAAPGKVAIIFTLAPTPDLKEYQIYRAAQNEPEPVKVATLPPDSLGYLDSKVRGGLQYSYAVVAVDLRGNASSASNVLSAQPPVDKLTAPADLKAVLGKDKVSLSWSDSPAALAYYVFRLEGKRRVQIAGPILSSSYSEPVHKGARYSVQAVSAAGTPGPMSAEVEAK